MARIAKLPRAKADLVEIWGYIAEDSDDQADAFIAVIDQKFVSLADSPHMGRPRDELAEGVRSFPVGKYVIFYRALPDGVEIVRVLHGARDVEALF